MRLSQASECGLRGLIVLARRPTGTTLLLREIADAGHLPPQFLSQVFQKLRRHGVVTSHRGAVRGYSLARPPAEITLRDVIDAIEGPGILERCAFWTGRCEAENPCCLHTWMAPVRQNLKETLASTTLAEVAG